MRGCLVTTGTLRQWVFDNPLHHFPFVSAGRAFVLVGRHSKAFLKCSVAVPRTSRDRAPPNANTPKQSTAGTGFLSSLVIASSLSSPSSPRSITPHAAPRRAKRCVRSHRLSSPHNPHRPFFRLPPTFRIHLAPRRLLAPIFHTPRSIPLRRFANRIPLTGTPCKAAPVEIPPPGPERIVAVTAVTAVIAIIKGFGAQWIPTRNATTTSSIVALRAGSTDPGTTDPGSAAPYL